jgi:hypothetical protein
LIGAIATVLIGVAAYFLSEPRKGTVEYHRRKYAEVGAPRWVAKEAVPGFVRNFYRRRYNLQREFHRTALIDSGYLKQRFFVVSNSSPLSVWRTAAHDLLVEMPKEVWSFSWIQQTNTNTLMVVAPRDWCEKIGDAIHKADVPAPK